MTKTEIKPVNLNDEGAILNFDGPSLDKLCANYKSGVATQVDTLMTTLIAEAQSKIDALLRDRYRTWVDSCLLPTVTKTVNKEGIPVFTIKITMQKA